MPPRNRLQGGRRAPAAIAGCRIPGIENNSWIDSHCHLEAFEDHASIVARATESGVSGMVTVGSDIETSRACVEIARFHPAVWAAVGVHPHDAESLDENSLRALREFCTERDVIAIGEIGLDYYRDLSPRPAQLRAFEQQLALAAELTMPVVLHIRDAFDDIFPILESTAGITLIFHCFGGDADQALRAQDLGGYISFAGNVTYKSAERLREAAKAVAAERMLVETDAPYLAPVPHRGSRNEPSLVRHVGEFLAELRQESVDQVRGCTRTNFFRAFGIDHPG